MTTEVQHVADVVQRELNDVRRILDAMAQLMRDSQITQAGTEKLTTHARQQLLDMVHELRTWSTRAEGTWADALRRIQDLEDDHGRHDALMERLTEVAEQNNQRFEELLGLRSSPAPAPLAQNVTEILASVRKLTDRDPHNGEPVTWIAVLGKQLSLAFWTAVSTSIILYALKALLPYTAGAPIPGK